MIKFTTPAQHKAINRDKVFITKMTIRIMRRMQVKSPDLCRYNQPAYYLQLQVHNFIVVAVKRLHKDPKYNVYTCQCQY